MKNNKLEVGDVLIEYRQWGLIDKLIVVRLTAKQAVLNNGCKCLIEVMPGNDYEDAWVKKIGSYGHYYLNNEKHESEIKSRLLKVKLKNSLSNFSFSMIPEEDYQKVIDFIKQYSPKPTQP